ncbi:hypothetical protein B0H34DRAFT_702627 [Crassisporium funariophilum]|nr:hypothetical protein B0H34DRAFT_702627 [Crassisporium funariophilum]
MSVTFLLWLGRRHLGHMANLLSCYKNILRRFIDTVSTCHHLHHNRVVLYRCEFVHLGVRAHHSRL